MKDSIIIDGNTIYELDSECMRKREEGFPQEAEADFTHVFRNQDSAGFSNTLPDSDDRRRPLLFVTAVLLWRGRHGKKTI